MLDFLLPCFAVLATDSLCTLGLQETPSRPFPCLFGLYELENFFQGHILVFIAQEVKLYLSVCKAFNDNVSENIVGVVDGSVTGWAGCGELADTGLTAEAGPKVPYCLVSVLLHVAKPYSGDHSILLTDSKLLDRCQDLLHCFIGK